MKRPGTRRSTRDLGRGEHPLARAAPRQDHALGRLRHETRRVSLRNHAHRIVVERNIAVATPLAH